MDSARWFARLIEDFVTRFGVDRRICLYEAPGRVNLMGMHIDQGGGAANPVATRERIRAVCARRDDDLIRAISRFRSFGEGQFELSQRLPPKPMRSLGEWLSWTERQAQVMGGGRDFINYFACGPIYAASFFYAWPMHFVGGDFVLDSDLPPSAGLSSSSAVVVLATDFFLRCNADGRKELTLEELLDIYGNGEWYIGTRGGRSDHAAIKLCRRGSVQPMITTPEFRALEPAPIPPGFDIILYPSGDEANKSVEPFKTGFNSPIISYQAGQMLLTDFVRDRDHQALDVLLAKRSSMDAKHHHVYLGDVVNDGLLGEAEIYQFLRQVPTELTGQEMKSRFGACSDTFRESLDGAAEPPRGYRVRDVTGFGFGECARGYGASQLLGHGDMVEFAQWMNVSQLGDRVKKVIGRENRRVKFLQDAALLEMERQKFPIRRLAGDYHVSTAHIDRLVSICRSCSEVLGARLTGAGLGGMLVVLGREGFDEALDPVLRRDYYEPLDKEFAKIRIIPSHGAGFY